MAIRGVRRGGRARVDAAAVSDVIHGLRFDQLPAGVIEQAQRCVLDLLGVAAAGAGTRMSVLAREHAARHFGAVGSGARMLFDGRRVSPVGAALAGGMTIDSVDGHDGHALTKGHVGAAVLPALLAVADGDADLDGPGLLTAVVLGYELGIRAGMALHATAGDYHSSGAWNALAAAGITAWLLRLEPSATEHALGIAEYQAPRGPMMRCIDHPTMVKDGSGWGAMTGVSAGLLAADGFTGAPALLVHATQPDVAVLWADLGVRWRILELYFKPHPVCRWAQPAVQAALQLRARHQLIATDIAHVEILTFAHAARLATRRPATTEQAQYSLPFPVATALAHGTVGSTQIDSPDRAQKQVRRLSDGMLITVSDEYTARFPAQRWAEVTVVLRDGRCITSGPTTAAGDPDQPLTNAELTAKFHAHADDELGTQLSATITTAVRQLTDPASNLDQLLEPILRPIRPANPPHNAPPTSHEPLSSPPRADKNTPSSRRRTRPTG